MTSTVNDYSIAQQPSTDGLSYALNYAALGWRVLPLHTPTDTGCSCGNSSCKSVGKHPRTENGLKDASNDPAIIEAWFERWPDANIGVATGAHSNLVVIDVDPRHGGFESLAALPDNPPETITQKTGGGLQFFYAHPGEPIKNSAGQFAPGIDVRGDGGYVVAPPSLHASGERYIWLAEQGNLAPLGWLLPRLKEPKQGANVATDVEIIVPGIEPVPEVVPDGQRNVTLIKLAGYMRRKGFSERAIFEALRAENERICRPPVELDELARIVRNAMRYAPGESLVDPLDEIDPDPEAETVTPEDEGGYTFGELKESLFPEGELILYGLYRGELGKVDARPSAGKSTLLRNLSIALCCGDTFEPFVPPALAGKPRRVMYLDFEERVWRIQRDFTLMASRLDRERAALLDRNLYVIPAIDKLVDGMPLELSEASHLAWIARQAVRHKADLIIVDTLAASANLFDENSNAEIQRKILRPLLRVQSLTNAAILLVDHVGKKKTEGGASEDEMMLGRGASAKAGAARLIVHVKQPDPNDKTKIVVTNPKDKVGGPFPDTVMRLSADRWFIPTSETISRPPTSLERVVTFVRDAGGPVSRSSLLKEFSDLSPATIDRATRDALARGDLKQYGRGLFTAVSGVVTLITDYRGNESDNLPATGTEG